MKTKRYNILKLHEIKHHRDKDKRMGRYSFQKEKLAKLREEEEQLHLNSIAYYVKRNEENRKIRNSSFINLFDKIKERNRYQSIEK